MNALKNFQNDAAQTSPKNDAAQTGRKNVAHNSALGRFFRKKNKEIIDDINKYITDDACLQLLVEFPLKTIVIKLRRQATVHELRYIIVFTYNLFQKGFYLTNGGRYLNSDRTFSSYNIVSGDVIRINFFLNGGKPNIDSELEMAWYSNIRPQTAVNEIYAEHNVAKQNRMMIFAIPTNEDPVFITIHSERTVKDLITLCTRLGVEIGWLSYGMKPLRLNMKLIDYDFPNVLITLTNNTGGLLGGSDKEFRRKQYYTSKHLKIKYKNKINQAQIQSEEEFNFEFIKSFFKGMGEKDADYYVKLVEDTALCSILMTKSNDKAEFLLAILTFLKLRLNDKSLFSSVSKNVKKMCDDIFETFIQSTEDAFDIIRGLLNNFGNIQETNTYKKLFKLFTYVLSVCIFSKMGIQVELPMLGAVQKELFMKAIHKGNEFITVILQSIIFIVERVYTCIKTRSFKPLFSSPDVLSEWNKGVYTLKIQANFLGNPEPHGFNKFDFIDRLNKHIEKGDAFLKHSNFLDIVSRKLITSQLNDIKMIKALELTKSAAGQERKAPFSLLVFGKSSIAKSVFVDINFAHYAKLHNMPKGPEYIYTRNPADDYWSGFDSSKWGLKMDDVAFMHPNKGTDIDPTLKEIIQVINNVPYLPAQADLADKGKTPLHCELVTATTNTEHLNAQFYFSCPLAVRRRLPWVVELLVKKEYKQDGGNHMIDPAKLPLEINGYPDYWDIIVKKVMPKGDEVTLEEIAVFSNINDYLVWFSKETFKFKQQQNNVMNINQHLTDLKICHICYRPIADCVCQIQSQTFSESYPRRAYAHYKQNQGSFEDILLSAGGLFDWEEHYANNTPWYLSVPMLVLEMYWVTFVMLAKAVLLYPCYFVEWGVLKGIKLALIYCIQDFKYYFYNYIFAFFIFPFKFVYIRACNYYLRLVSSYIYKKIEYHKVTTVVAALTCLLAAYKFYSSCKKLSSTDGETQSVPVKTTVSTTYRDAKEESTTISTVYKDKGKEPQKDTKPRPDVWFNDFYQTTSFDLMPQAVSYSRFNREQLVETLKYNVIHINAVNASEGKVRPTKAVCLGGHYWMANSHGIPTNEVIELNLIYDDNNGINSNITFIATQNIIKRIPDRDICILYLRQIPPRKDIRGLFCKKSMQGNHKGFYLRRNRIGAVEAQPVNNINYLYTHVTGLQLTVEVFEGLVETPTQNGDCGSLLIAESPCFNILGIHVYGALERAGALKISHEDVMEWTSNFYDDVPLVQSGGKLQIQAVPKLSCEDRERNLAGLHMKSPFRYIEQGTAEIKGSFTDFRPSPVSKVAKTFISDRICQEEGYSLLHTKPPMSGWEVKNRNLQGMVNPVTDMRPDIIEECAKAFYDDIKAGLSDDQLSMIEVYNDDVTLNGAEGVAYVNKINRNTSMGAPWKRSKKYYLDPIPDTDKVQLTDAVMQRIRDNERIYANGERCHAVFSMTLKDEPITHAKAKIHKVRSFQNAPTDLNFLDRKYNLSFIRLVQNNKTLFECACGIVAQSTEWNELREYLDEYKNAVAGDYKEYDKRMPAIIIFYAYMIKLWLQRDAGYSKEELQIVHGIDTDKTYPLIDCFGDLAQFYNGNPSGQTLTVIVNSLVNSLYMRYAYYMLNPNKECRSFKKNVKLMTYGDDNIMTVHPDCPWFNHTSISQLLGTIGITYTMADKEAESVPYISLAETSFLKRVWRYDDDIGTYVCPLDHDSINKMLTICVVSKTITPELQAIASISTAIREYFWYGKDVFNKKRCMLQQVINDCDIAKYQQESTLPTWEELYEKFWETSKLTSLD